MKKIFILCAMFSIMLVIISCNNIDNKNLNNTSTITNVEPVQKQIIFVYNTQLPDSLKAILENTIYEYDKLYNIQRDSLFIIDTLIPRKKISRNVSDLTEAQATHRKIILNRNYFIGTTLRAFRDVIVHELFHTLSPLNYTKIKPFVLEPEVSVMGYSGLKIKVKLEGKEAFFLQIEEASAEVCAYTVYNNYEVNNKHYNQVAKLMLSMVQMKWIEPVDLTDAVQVNNLPKIVGLILKKQENEVTTTDIILIVDLFSKTWDNNDYKDNLKKIITCRKEEGKYQIN